MFNKFGYKHFISVAQKSQEIPGKQPGIKT
nr:MAG TPA: hypothetical protein [Caudoviricetes sp.]